MDTEGTLAPSSPAEARAEYETLVPAAKVTVRETAKAMGFDAEEYAERVTGEVIESVRDALFASLLRVHVGTRAEYEAWLDDHPEYEPDPAGSDAPPVVAATWQAEREAALATLRRRAFGRVYREHLTDGRGAADPGERDDGTDPGGSDADPDGET
ncbi:hypothetical protein BRC97_10590 [Halobacteriales archaeon QS_6_71_20]|nr:MAG: hypothetical protein BRC97_10590 [Halobacteriales archaeon QS_6_71_20]